MSSELEDLRYAAERRRPRLEFPGTTRLEQMINAFLEARGYILQIIPAGSAINYDTALAAASLLDVQIAQRKPGVRSAMESGADGLEEDDAPRLSYDQSPHYWLAQYQIASEGLGAYASGEMERRTGSRDWMAQDYDRSIEARLTIFSQIVDAGRKGYLNAFVTPQAYANSAAAAAPRTAMMLRTGRLQPTGRQSIVIGPDGTDVRLGVVDGRAGLGVAPVAVIALAASAVVVLVSTAIVAGAIYYSLERRRLQASAQLARDVCMKAAENKDRGLMDACAAMGGKLGTPTSVLEQIGGSKLQDYLVWGGVALAGIYLAPMIVDSLMSARATIRKHTGDAG